LLAHPRYLEILRKLANLSHTEFERLYFSKYKSRFCASNYEVRQNTMGKKVSARLAELFSELFKNLKNTEFEKVIEYNKRVKISVDSHKIGNKAEEIVQKLLEKNNVIFYKHARIIGYSGIAHKVDFLIGTKYEPFAIIEVKKSNELKHNSMAKTKELVATAVDINKKHKLLFLVYLAGSFSDDSISFLKSYCDEVVLDEQDLANLIRGLNAKRL